MGLEKELSLEKLLNLELRNEIIRLKRIIKKELSENDELGAEYTYVQCLKYEIEELKRKLEIAKNALIEAAEYNQVDDVNGEAGYIAYKALKELGE